MEEIGFTLAIVSVTPFTEIRIFLVSFMRKRTDFRSIA